MGRLARKAAGFACVGLTYQAVKKLVKSDSFVGSALYSAIAGLSGAEAYKLLDGDSIAERIRQLLAYEDPAIVPAMRNALYEKIPNLEQRMQLPQPPHYDPMQELKRQIMKEKGYL